MITYDECLAKVGYNLESIPVAECEFLAYKNGEVKSFDSQLKAENYSQLVERRARNQKEIDDRLADLQKFEHAAIILFRDLVREDISDFSDDLWNLCWNAAYRDSHSWGYDDVANSAIKYVEFAEKVIKLSNEEREFKRLTRD